MKIAIIVRRLNVRGGTQHLAARLGIGLRTLGHEVVFYTLDYSRPDCYPEHLSDFQVVEADRELVDRMYKTSRLKGMTAFVKNYLNENRAIRNLASKIAADTDILNPHDQLAYRVSRYFKREVKNIPSVWTMNDISTKKSSLERDSTFDRNIRANVPKKLFYWLFDRFEYIRFIKYQDVISVLDRRNLILAREQFPGPKIVIARSGIDPDRFCYKERQVIAGNNVRIFTFASFLPHRRFEDAIMAVSILRQRKINATLSIFGANTDASYHRKIQDLISGKSLNDFVNINLNFTQQELGKEFAKADIFLFPCHLQTWGLAVFEAMAAGLPVIVSETTGATDVLEDKETAIVVPPFEPSLIAQAVEEMMMKPELYHKLSVSGRRFILKNLKWDSYARSVVDMVISPTL